ncbi:transposase [Paracoccus laeviglucosivorans]|uniref:transposase n=1 Tax=Paracoccus laeviglucosivorans TaxID=1197861 RepID=UPI001158A3AA
MSSPCHEIIQSSHELAESNRQLQSVSGVGTIVAATLMAELPEIGTTDRRKIAALAGLAPIAWDSGQRCGKRVSAAGDPPSEPSSISQRYMRHGTPQCSDRSGRSSRTRESR